MPGETAQKWLEDNAARLSGMADEIWRLAEVGTMEFKSSEIIASNLEHEGFSVQRGVGGIPTAFVAAWGSGTPVIGILGEYDALPGMSQKVQPVKEPVVDGAAGHGCGHNLLGVGSLGAAIGAKREMEAHRLPGTIRYYGCPAEETLMGKVFMARDGVFDDLDAALTWHPMNVNTVWASSTLAVNSVRFTFTGRAAHAAGAPHLGISALDAVELMNVGVNYLREHVIQEARIHYVIPKGGGEPNIVPPIAQSWYYVRAPRRIDLEPIYARIIDVAKGAALMTGANLQVDFQAGCYEVLPNSVLGDVLYRSMQRAGAPVFTDDEWRLAREIENTYVPGQKESAMRAINAPKGLHALTLHDSVVKPFDEGRVLPGSTDVGDVSWIAPTAQITTACWVMGTAAHSWQAVVASGSGIGHKGMMLAARTLALACLDLVEAPQVVARAREEFQAATGGRPYVSPLPEGAKPPLNQITAH